MPESNAEGSLKSMDVFDFILDFLDIIGFAVGLVLFVIWQKKKSAVPSDLQGRYVLQYGTVLRGIVFAYLILTQAAFGYWLLSESPKGEGLLYGWLINALFLLPAIFSIIEVLRVSHVVDSSAIEGNSPWHPSQIIRWDQVENIRLGTTFALIFAEGPPGFVIVEGPDDKEIKVFWLLENFGTFCRLALEHAPQAIADDTTKALLERKST